MRIYNTDSWEGYVAIWIRNVIDVVRDRPGSGCVVLRASESDMMALSAGGTGANCSAALP